MTLGYAKMLADMGVEVGPPREWPIEWIDFRPHPCPHWPGVELYRKRLRKELDIEPVVLCRECFSILDGWHRVAACWLEGRRSVPIQLADRHLAGAEECCRVGNVNWIQTLRPWADLSCVSGSYHESDWSVLAFVRVRDSLRALGGGGAPKMREWERVRSICFLGNVARKKILDVGTRDSLVPHWLAKRRAEAHAVDLNVSTIEDDGSIEIHQGDIRNLSAEFSDETFDHVLCVAVLKSIPGQGDSRAVTEMIRILKPRGLLAISVDYGQKYLECPSEATGVRLYNKQALYDRIIHPSRCELQGPVNFDRSDWRAWPIRHQSPKAFKAGVNVQTAFVLLRKPV